MRDQPKDVGHAVDFEFEALALAVNYRRALFAEFGPFLRGDVVEVGAGIGQMTEVLARLPGISRAVAVEPDPGFCARHRARFPAHEVVEGTVSSLPADTAWDAVLSINVLEHIREDEAELRRYAELLRGRRGALCLFVPARPEIYAPIDRDFGHFRRYTRPELRGKLAEAGFKAVRLHYFNGVGYLIWWLNFCVLKQRRFEPRKVRWFDRAVFPVVYALERRVLRPPLGQSLVAVARSGA
jgi:SAM-dependent methyltransferase